jgi:phosphatidylinositol glycan class N
VVLYLYKKNKGCFNTMTKVVLVIQFLILVSAVVILNHSAYNLSLKRGIPRINHIFSWSTVICCVFLPILVTDALVLRLLSTTMSLFPVYLLLSTSYEALFFLVLSSTMALWLTLEHQLSSCFQDYPNTSLAQIPVHDPRDGHARKVSFDDLRCAFFFVYFIITAFFGTGNIASINTFDPTTVYCFITVFSPFVMGSLLILKILIPFVVVTCVFDAVHVVCKVPVNRLFLLVLIMTDFLALQFFYLVQDYGSWLEIGTSISHFVIMLSFIIYLFFIFGIARYFTRNTWWNSIKTHIQ